MNQNSGKPISLPYQANYEELKKWRSASEKLFWIVIVFAIATTPFISKYYQDNQLLNGFIQYFNYLIIIAYYAVDVITETFLYPATARLRRMGFIDNSLGTQFLNEATKNYYTNDELKPGIYKLCVNCFENCYFTYNIAKETSLRFIVKNSILIAIFLAFAYIGLQGNFLILPILQILLSTIFLTGLIHHLNFLSRLKILLERFRTFFSDTKNDKSKRDEPQHPIWLFLEYETTLAFNKAPVSTPVYNKLNAKLSEEWEKTKKYYEIT